MVITAVLVSLGLSATGPQAIPPPPPPPPVQGPVRDPGLRAPADIKGTGVIRGRVVAADTGTPIRRAQVNLSITAPAITPGTTPGGTPAGTQPPMPSMRSKSATTDAQGVFEFRELPAGSYRLMASPGQYSAAYLSIAYGAKRPNGGGSFDPGTPIDLADGQTFGKATIGLPRGAVITGRVVDENGEALARVQVYTILYSAGATRGVRTGGSGSTDDLGQFRLYGLTAGDFVVAAEARGNMYVPPNAPPETEEDKIGFLTTFFPASVDEASAQRVRTKAGVETPGVEIRMVSGRLFHITGMVVDSQGRPSPRSNGTLFRRSGSGVVGAQGFSSDEQGRFQMRGLAPGNYRLNVQQQPQGTRNLDGSPADRGEMASLPLAINSDMDDILVTTAPGVSLTGTVVFESGPPQVQGSQPLVVRVNAMSGDPDNAIGVPTPPPVPAGPDLTFTLKGLMGDVLIRANAPNSTVKQVLLAGGEDITDTPREFKNGERVTIVLTSRPSTVEGNVTDAAGKPVAEASLLMFSEDKGSWRSNSVRTRRSGVDANGHFRISSVLPGRYFIVALPRERIIGLTLGSDPAVWEALSKEATTVVVGDDEQRQVDLKVAGGSQY